MTASVDHVVTMTSDLEKAAAAARRLGFHCTPESRHSVFSSVNRTIVFENEYWELLAFLAETPANAQLRNFAGLRSGINGISASSDDLDRSIIGAQASGLDMDEPISFGRNILHEGVEREVGFRVANALRAPDGLLIFYCQHRTRELVWRKEWRAHRNGAFALGSLTLFSKQPLELATDIARLFGRILTRTGEGRLRIDTHHHTLTVESPDHAADVARLIGRKPHGTAVLGVRCGFPDAALSYAETSGVSVSRTTDGRYLAFDPALGDLVVEFVT